MLQKLVAPPVINVALTYAAAAATADVDGLWPHRLTLGFFTGKFFHYSLNADVTFSIKQQRKFI